VFAVNLKTGHCHVAEKSLTRIMCGHGQTGVSVTDWSQKCLWTRRERGMCLATEKPLPLEKLEKSLFQAGARFMLKSPRRCPEIARKLPGNSLDDSSDVARTPSPTLRGLLRGCQHVCCVICGRTATAIAKSPASRCANHGADIHRRCVRHFPPTAWTLLGSCPAIARMIHRMRRGLRR
jgi:hypothetical protein